MNLKKNPNIIEEINPEIREVLEEMGADGMYKCYQCGKCTSICPWFQVGTYDFPVFRISLEAVLGMIASSEDKDELAHEVDKIYRCVGCEACLDLCPHGIHTPNILRAARRLLVDFGSYPDTLKSVVQKIHNVGNPLGESGEKRADWAKEFQIQDFRSDMELLYFPCCIPAYDPRMQRVAQATAKILQQSGLSFGILGSQESCCGEAIRRVGAEEIFEEVANANISAFEQSGVTSVLVTSPHCYTSFKHDYPELGANFTVLHATQLFSDLLEQGKLNITKRFEKKVVYHDPCILGRQNGIYEEPRKILKSIPGLELVEVESFNRSLSLCCGAGSGALWMEWDKEERIGDIRIKQLVDTGAELIAVACPYCLQMFEETIKSMTVNIEVMDIAEILDQCLS